MICRLLLVYIHRLRIQQSISNENLNLTILLGIIFNHISMQSFTHLQGLLADGIFILIRKYMYKFVISCVIKVDLLYFSVWKSSSITFYFFKRENDLGDHQSFIFVQKTSFFYYHELKHQPSLDFVLKKPSTDTISLNLTTRSPGQTGSRSLEVLQMKDSLLETSIDSINSPNRLILSAKSLTRIAADIREEDWFKKLQASGFIPEKNTVWIIEGIIYYLPHSQAMAVLQTIADNCTLTQTVLLADFMNKQSTNAFYLQFSFLQ